MGPMKPAWLPSVQSDQQTGNARSGAAKNESPPSLVFTAVSTLRRRGWYLLPVSMLWLAKTDASVPCELLSDDQAEMIRLRPFLLGVAVAYAIGMGD